MNRCVLASLASLVLSAVLLGEALAQYPQQIVVTPTRYTRSLSNTIYPGVSHAYGGYRPNAYNQVKYGISGGSGIPYPATTPGGLFSGGYQPYQEMYQQRLQYRLGTGY